MLKGQSHGKVEGAGCGGGGVVFPACIIHGERRARQLASVRLSTCRHASTRKYVVVWWCGRRYDVVVGMLVLLFSGACVGLCRGATF